VNAPVSLAGATPAHTRGPLAIDRLLRPRSVVIVGASEKPGALGASVLANLERQGFSGDIHLINPKRAEIHGRPCLPSVEALPEGVDAAVLAIPRAAVLDTVRQLAARKVGAVVIFSAGFAEGGAEGLAEQREIARIAAEASMVVEGPNCLGMVNFVDGVPLTFVELPATRLQGRPGLAIVSQSGAMAAVLGVTLLKRELGLSYSVSTGNEAGSGVEDYVDFLVDDPDTRVIAMIVEQFRKPARFLAAAERARKAGKPIVLLHPGRSSAARESAATHTGAMTGDYQVMIAKVARAGVLQVETLEELGDVAEILIRAPKMGQGGAVIMGESGAFKALMLDLAEQVGLDLPVVHDHDSPALRDALPEFVPVSNPLDLTAQGLSDPDLYRRTLRAALADERFGSVLIGIIQTDQVTSDIKYPPILDVLGEGVLAKPVILAGLDEDTAPANHVAALRQRSIPYFPTSERAVRALARIAAWTGRDAQTAQADPVRLSGLPTAAGVIAEHRSKALLAEIGVPFPKGRLATTLEEAKAAAADLGYPLVIKAQSPDLPHKSEAGGVLVGLKDEAALEAGWAKLHANIAHHRPDLKLDGVLVEAMGARGVEMIVGARSDPEWGPVVLVGFGGVQAEILQDVRLLTPDLTEAAIAAEIGRLKSAALLQGFRGAPPCDVPALARLVSRVGALMRAEPSIAEIDLNPVVVFPQGEGVVALDALIYTRDA
jgi:acetate---CoA ligase (ADP-forming)